MSFETGGTFSPSKRNPVSRATGLIQFMSSTAKWLGTTTTKLANMTPIEQLDFVEKDFQKIAGGKEIRTLEDTYMAVLFPAAIGKGSNHVLFRQGTTAYKQNKGLDLNRKGGITVAEAASLVRSRIL